MQITFRPNHGAKVFGKSGDVHFNNVRTTFDNPLAKDDARLIPVLQWHFLWLRFTPVTKSLVRKAGGNVA